MEFLEFSILDIIDIILVAFLLFQLYKLVRGTVAIKDFRRNFSNLPSLETS